MADKQYPYVVIRVYAGVYVERAIKFGERHDKEPLDPLWVDADFDGEITPSLKESVVAALQNAARDRGFRMCVVFAPDECIYAKPDGTIDGGTPPSGGLMDLL